MSELDEGIPFRRVLAVQPIRSVVLPSGFDVQYAVFLGYNSRHPSHDSFSPFSKKVLSPVLHPPANGAGVSARSYTGN